jgi:UDP-N-acetylmuramoyl-L-alanyl-D-glutamate--2,6-diaminopimelate ligase
MNEEPQEKVRGSLPKRLAKNATELYRRGRAKFISARYGNPAETVRVIAIVGPYGKTTTARLVGELLKEAGRTVAVRVNDDAGQTSDDFVSLLQQDLKKSKQQKMEFFILEATPALLASGALSGVVLDTVVVTGASKETDTLLEQAVNYAVVPDDHHFGALAIAEHQIISFGEQDSAEAKIDKLTLYRKGTEIEMTIDHHTALTVATHLVGKANAYNLAAAIAAAYVLGVAFDTVEEGAAHLEGLKGNYQYLPGDHPYVLVVDAAQTDRSVELVVGSAKQLAKRRLIVALCADSISDDLIASVKKKADRLVLVTKKELALPGVEVVTTTEEAVLIAQRAAKKEDTVLLLGEPFVEGGISAIPDSEKEKS